MSERVKEKKRTFELGEFEVGDYETKPTDDGRGTKSVRLGKKRGIVDVEIDFAALWRYAEQALRSKGGVRTMADGAIKFKVAAGTVKRTREEEPVT